MTYIWFWTFWHWSKESRRVGSLLRNPLHGIASHWDEWYLHEATKTEHAAIEAAGHSESSQRDFIAWLLRHWLREAGFPRNRRTWRFVLAQLSQVHPFNHWPAFEKYRDSYGVDGISAIVLTEGSAGEADDVRKVEALSLPPDDTAPAILTEGFHAESIDLETARQAARSLLDGKGFLVFIGLWLAAGRRSYPAWLKAGLSLGWLAVAGTFFYLMFGPDPGGRLHLLCAALTAAWAGLTLAAVLLTGGEAVRAWKQGRAWRARLDESQVRLRMDGGLTLKGASAGLPFCLNTLRSLYDRKSRSWLWREVLCGARSSDRHWAATGVITADGALHPVVLAPKLRACLQREGVKHILTPRQPDAVRPAASPLPARQSAARAQTGFFKIRLGFAAEEPGLQIHPCRHAAQALLRMGALTSAPQMILNSIAVAATVAMLISAGDLRNILRPPPAPVAKAPSSNMPGWLWVSLGTKKPDCFLVELESDYWANRRALVATRGGANPSTRAEIQLRRSPVPGTDDREDGMVWVVRRQRLLNREFMPGERVGRYDLAYLNTLAHD